MAVFVVIFYISSVRSLSRLSSQLCGIPLLRLFESLMLSHSREILYGYTEGFMRRQERTKSKKLGFVVVEERNSRVSGIFWVFEWIYGFGS